MRRKDVRVCVLLQAGTEACHVTPRAAGGSLVGAPAGLLGGRPGDGVAGSDAALVDEQSELPMVTIENNPELGLGDTAPPEEEEKEKALLPNSAVTVAYGQLFVATHIDILPASIISRTAVTFPRALQESKARSGRSADTRKRIAPSHRSNASD